MAQTIFGQPAGSEQEFFIAKSLWQLGHRFRYQVQALGIPGVRGTQIIDFVVDTTAPLPTPIFYHGEHWHSGHLGSEDYFKLITLTHNLRGFMREPLVIYGKEHKTKNEIYHYLKMMIGPF